MQKVLIFLKATEKRELYLCLAYKSSFTAYLLDSSHEIT